ncbi:MAG: helix-turn-helix domain-containing protein [Candidatus Accumulibacter sp. UW25]|jgi:excisionase family DNA binding protein
MQQELKTTTEHCNEVPTWALMNVNTACAMLSLSRSSFYRLVKSGKLQTVKLGATTRVRVGDVQALIGGLS